MNIQKFTWSLLLTFLTFTAFAQKQATKKGYNIRVKIEGYTNDTLILGYRLGSKTYVKDTCFGKDKDSKGYFVFKKDTLLEGGVYLILTKPTNTYFEFLIPNDNEQNLTLTTKPEGADMTKNLKVEGSPDNQAFLDYIHYLGDMFKKRQPIEQQFSAETDPEKKKALEEELNKLNKDVEAFQKNMFEKYASYLSVRLIKASQQPTIPKEIEVKGQPHTYYYFKNHYFDGYDWSDKRLVRTPVLEQKIEFYTDKLTPQDPDSVIVSCDYILDQVIKGGSKEVFQFVAAHLLNKYAQSKVICMDKVYVHLGTKYYCGAEKPEWIDSTQLEKICENVNDLRYAQCGQHAPQINLTNIKNGLPISLYGIKARFVVVYFWDPTCGNCTKNSKKLVPIYEKWKGENFEIYGICSKSIEEKEECEKKIKEVGMNWINSNDKSYPLAVVKKMYDVKVNPFIYILDQEKKIMYKRLDPEQVDEIITREIERLDKENPELKIMERELQKREKEAMERELKKKAEEGN